MKGRANTASSLKRRAQAAEQRAEERAASRALKIHNRNATAEGDDVESIELFRLGDRLTRGDRALLAAALDHPVDVEAIAPAPPLYGVVWLLHYGLMTTWIDARDRIWIRTTTAGAMLVSGGSTRAKRDKAARATS